MALALKQLEEAVLSLPRGERAHLARRLLVSLDEEVGEDPAEVERAWEEEIRRRLGEVAAGTAELIPAEQVFAELRGRRRFGSARGLIVIADDFDAPLDGFGE